VTDPSDPTEPTPEPGLRNRVPLPGSWSADEQDLADQGGGGRRLVLIAGAVVGVLAVIALALVAIDPFGSDAGEQAWPTDVGGRPAGLGSTGQLAEEVAIDAEPGAYLWSDFDGWHLWIVFGPGLESASGTIVSNEDLSKSVLTPRAAGTFEADGDTLSFDVSDADAAIAGLDFEPGFFAERLEVTIDGPDGPIEPAMVTLGASTEVAAIPIVIEKEDVGG
jgi:hypothetical protein